MLAPEFYAPLRHLGTQYHARLGAVAAAEQLIQILDTPPSQINPGKEPLAATPPFGVRFDEVSFSYGPGREVLKGLSLKIPPGKCITLIGPSGVVKKTVI
jgi:ABC-type transport system involved in cytochrome bd biosynthesis, ATPase and permease components